MDNLMGNLSKLCLVPIVLVLITACGGGGSWRIPNNAPNIAAISDAAISANQASDPIAIRVLDFRAENATVVATSADQAVVEDGGLTVTGGTDGVFSLQVQPVANTLGSTTITVTATDQAGLTGQTTFEVRLAQQQVDFSSFFRSTFAASPSDQPADLSSRQLNDAGGDDYADLLN